MYRSQKGFVQRMPLLFVSFLCFGISKLVIYTGVPNVLRLCGKIIRPSVIACKVLFPCMRNYINAFELRLLKL